MHNLTPFHVAIPVHDVQLARAFYRDVLNCPEGRSDTNWVDFNLYGHQFVIHYKPKSETQNNHHNEVDGHAVPVPHYGVVLEWQDWEALAQRLKDHEIKFIIEPHIRFEGQPGEQATMFFLDPCGNALEFKSFKDFKNIFAT
ncbi:MAG: VOC family protein [Saprospiraceae bacterium]|nr:VOC family protein [Bacteroidia bacterium]NNE16174.1 VOC family protein [Saprospiraceae bacterium]NNL91604.1 VOC family protein [Saprospiraceae bacterium]